MIANEDKWAKWLLGGRDGGDPEQRAKALEHLLPIRDRVLENAKITSGEVVLDVGGGDGLIAFGASDRVGAPEKSSSRTSQPTLSQTPPSWPTTWG